ncbi:MAG: hypothetical protein KC441_18740, partial [Anaerolineales bacterium]|nr:hypothetical protein [Anaerolineales bacterium]
GDIKRMCQPAAGERAGRSYRLLRPPCSAQQLWPGTGYLVCIQILARVRFIYQVAFPDRPEWQAETYAATNCGVRHALIALCLRFADHLFPLAFSLEWLQEIDVTRNFDAGELAAIPIAPRGVDVLGDPYFNGPAAFEPPYDFFAWGLIQEVYRGEVEDEDYLPAYHLPFPLPRTWSLTQTTHLIRQAGLPEPLNHLAVVAEYIAASTGNPWLDHEIDNYYEYIYEEEPIAWTPDNVRRLKQQFDEALELEHQMKAIETWVATDPHNHMKAILALMQILYANEHLNQFPEIPRPAAAGQPFSYLARLPSG